MKNDIILYYEQEINIVNQKKVLSIPYIQIYSICSEAPYTRINTTKYSHILVKMALINMTDQLPESFVLCNRSVIVNLLYVESIYKDRLNYVLRLNTQEIIPISKRKIKQIREKYLYIRANLKNLGFCLACNGLEKCKLNP